MADVTIEQLQDDNENLKQENQQLRTEIDELKKINASLTTELEEKPESMHPEVAVTSISKEQFEVDGKTFGFTCPAVLFEGKRITSVEVLADKELQAKLVEIGSGFIKEVQ